MRRGSLGLLLVLLAHAGWIVHEGLRDTPASADVAIVLGSTVHPDGTLSERLAARTGAALELYRAGRVACILVSGGTGDEGVNEAEAMAGWLEARGVPPSAVLVDPAGDNTRATARNARVLLDREGLRTAIAVSSYYHLVRTRLALEQEGVRVVGTHAAALVWEPREAWSILREIVAIYAYRFGARSGAV